MRERTPVTTDWRTDTWSRAMAAATDASRKTGRSVIDAVNAACDLAADALQRGDTLADQDERDIARAIANRLQRERAADTRIRAAMGDTAGVRNDARNVGTLTAEDVADMADTAAALRASKLSTGTYDPAEPFSIAGRVHIDTRTPAIRDAHARAVLAGWVRTPTRIVRGVRGPVTTCDPDTYAGRVIRGPWTPADAPMFATMYRVARAAEYAGVTADPSTAYAAWIYAQHAHTLTRLDRTRETRARVTAATGATHAERVDPYRVTRERTRHVLAAIADVLACLPEGAAGWVAYDTDPDPDAPATQRVSVLTLAGIPRHERATVTASHTPAGAWSPVTADLDPDAIAAHGSPVKRRGHPTRYAWNVIPADTRDDAGRVTYIAPRAGEGVVRGVRYRESANTVGAHTLAESHRPDTYAEDREYADALAYAVYAPHTRTRSRGRPRFDVLAALTAYTRTLTFAGVLDPSALAVTLTADPDAPDPYRVRGTLTPADYIAAVIEPITDQRGHVITPAEGVNVTALADALRVTRRALADALTAWHDTALQRAGRAVWDRTMFDHTPASRRMRAIARVYRTGARMLDPHTLTADACTRYVDTLTRTHPHTLTLPALIVQWVRLFDYADPDTPRRVRVLAGMVAATRATGVAIDGCALPVARDAWERGIALRIEQHAPVTVRVPRRLGDAVRATHREGVRVHVKPRGVFRGVAIREVIGTDPFAYAVPMPRVLASVWYGCDDAQACADAARAHSAARVTGDTRPYVAARHVPHALAALAAYAGHAWNVGTSTPAAVCEHTPGPCATCAVTHR